MSEAAPDPFAPTTLGPVSLRNRFLKAATFEGMAHGNLVTPELIAFHRRFAERGVAVETLAYCAISMDGRGAPNEVVVRDAATPGLREFADAIHAAGAAASMQLGHAGPVGAGRERPGSRLADASLRRRCASPALRWSRTSSARSATSARPPRAPSTPASTSSSCTSDTTTW